MKENDIKNKIEKFVSTLPNTLAVIGYGSGVIPQDSSIDAKKQIDLFIVVDDKVKWNRENIIKNPNYYSATSKLFFNNANEKIQNLGAKICYIPYINYNGDTYKIGVTDSKNLISDLEYWESFYLAGRFQKDILFINVDDSILKAIKSNREKALMCALLLLEDDEKNLKTLYKKICSLSYIGDIRNSIAEDKNKIDNLSKDYEKYKQIYGTNSKYFKVTDNHDNIEINYSEIFNDIVNLPIDLFIPLYNYLKTNTVLFHFVSDLTVNNLYLSKDKLMEIRKILLNYFKEINKQASIKQSIKGILTAGPVNSSKYVYAKLQKGILAKFYKKKDKEKILVKEKTKK